MTETPDAPAAGHAHAGPSFNTYLVIFGALSVFTAFSFIFNMLARQGTITHETSFVLILGVAVCKAALVGAYFMHLLTDWRKVYYLIIPAFILGALLMVVLLPDIVLGWHQLGSAAASVH